jgi:quinol monooxygenase YgiN
MAIRLTVQMQIQPGKAQEFEAIAGAAAKRVRAEDKGCEMYHLYRSIDDDTRYVLVEAWTTAEDLTAHRTTPGMSDMQKIGPLLAGRPVMHRYEA